MQDQTLPYYTILYTVDRGGACRLASSFGRKTRRLPDNVAPAGEQGTRRWREGTGTGNRDGNTGKHDNRDGDGNGSGNKDEKRGESLEERGPGSL